MTDQEPLPLAWEAIEQARPGTRLRMAMQPHYTSESGEWYTPLELVERVVQVLGTIDLDPCSNSKTEPWIPATNHFTKEDDGFSRSWHGRVYCNPPYGRIIAKWVQHLADEYACGNVTEAIALVPARTDTRWFRQLPGAYVCFVSGRLRFSGQGNAAPFPSCAVYMGTNPVRFVNCFAPVGLIFQRITKTEDST